MQNAATKYRSDLHVRCFAFSLSVIKLCDKLPNKRSAWVITDQVIRSATSIGANIVEAQAASSRLEFKRYYEISLKSANETVYWLSLLRDAALIENTSVAPLLLEVTELGKMLASAVIKLKKAPT